MLNVSPQYKEAITAPTEISDFYGIFQFIPPGAREGGSIATTNFGKVFGSRIYQLDNEHYDGMDERWMSLEQGRVALNGKSIFIDTTKTQQTGDWSIPQSDGSGNFTIRPYLDYILDKPYELIGCHLWFDDKGEEWATSITLQYYNASGGLMATKTVTNNKSNCPIDLNAVGVKSLRAILNSWNIPYRFAKVCQFIPGQIHWFRGDNTFNFELKESITPYSSLIIPEYNITFNNENQRYNVINPVGITDKLKLMMNVRTNIGVQLKDESFERVNTGEFYLFSWPNDANNDISTFTCRPSMAFTEGEYSYTGVNIQPLQQVVDRISYLAKLDKPIIVDSSVSPGGNINANIGTGISLSNALSQLCTRVNGYIKFNRDGSYRLMGLTYPAPTYNLTRENMYGELNVVQSPPIAAINIRYYRPGLDGMQEELVTFSDFGRTINLSCYFENTAGGAADIAQKAFTFFNKRMTYTIPFRGDMSIEAGDTINVETEYGFRPVFILKNNIYYDSNNFLQGELIGVGI